MRKRVEKEHDRVDLTNIMRLFTKNNDFSQTWEDSEWIESGRQEDRWSIMGAITAIIAEVFLWDWSETLFHCTCFFQTHFSRIRFVHTQFHSDCNCARPDIWARLERSPEGGVSEYYNFTQRSHFDHKTYNSLNVCVSHSNVFLCICIVSITHQSISICGNGVMITLLVEFKVELSENHYFS